MNKVRVGDRIYYMARSDTTGVVVKVSNRGETAEVQLDGDRKGQHRRYATRDLYAVPAI